MKDLEHKIKKYWRIILALQRNNLMTTTAYKQNFIVMTIAVIIYMAISIIFLKVIFGYINNIAGWNYYEILMIIGSVMIVDGLLWVFGARVGALGQRIRKGTLDGLITKPADTQFLISFWECDHEDIPRIIIGSLLVYYGVTNLNINIETLAVNFFFYLILLFNAAIITYSLTLILKTMYFWTIVDYSLHS
ncbi:MAG: ABC-2 family transporter protein, partial [Candidatus Moraniibacteriota bacterium]